ncbi:unnamed protein product [Amoebophrya sp. A120]|nr:unnamed protein product [Amoebophrya sp. A120]|eukprot:GSA120T00019966001.1
MLSRFLSSASRPGGPSLRSLQLPFGTNGANFTARSAASREAVLRYLKQTSDGAAKRFFASAEARAHSGQVLGNPRGLSTFGVGSRGGRNSPDWSLHLVGGCFTAWFAMGGVSGVALGNAAVDVTLHDTYYVVGHFHIIMVSTIALAIGLANAAIFGPAITVSAARALPTTTKRVTSHLLAKGAKGVNGIPKI